jgi:elongation factor 2
MVKFTLDQVSNIMQHQEQIRNMSVIAHVDHGKSTLSDALICKAGLLTAQDAGKKRWTMGREDEQDQGITIKSTGVTMHYRIDF